MCPDGASVTGKIFRQISLSLNVILSYEIRHYWFAKTALFITFCLKIRQLSNFSANLDVPFLAFSSI